jgi:lipid-A-disaccharide synthase
VSGPLIYLLAAEPSGDRLGAALMQALAAEAPGVEIAGIGGREMRAAGLDPLFDIAELSVMGITEVVPRLPAILRRLSRATEDVLARRPGALVTIDAPSFGLRVAARVRARDPAIRTVHYVAPSVWAWRPGRAARMARFVDQVLALLPFEPPWMEAAGMRCDFVGHPVAERPAVAPEEAAAFRAARGIGAEAPLLLVAPGSRRGEVARLAPVFGETAAALAAERQDVALAVPVAETVAEEVTAWAAGLAPRPHLVTPEDGEGAKRAAAAAADAALVASGTVALEMAAAGTPHVSTYRTSALTAAIVRRLVRIDTAHIVNLVLGERLVPEFLQERCTAGEIAPALAPLLGEGRERAAQVEGFDRALALLGRGGEPPSRRAARAILDGLS